MEWRGDRRVGIGEEAETAGGVREVGLTLIARGEESKGIGVEEGPGGTAAGRDATSDATSEDVDAAGTGGCNGTG